MQLIVELTVENEGNIQEIYIGKYTEEHLVNHYTRKIISYVVFCNSYS